MVPRAEHPHRDVSVLESLTRMVLSPRCCPPVPKSLLSAPGGLNLRAWEPDETHQHILFDLLNYQLPKCLLNIN